MKRTSLQGAYAMQPDSHEIPKHITTDEEQDWINRVVQARRPVRLGSLGQFEVLSESNRGGQGVVHRAVQPSTGREVAIKRVRSGFLASRKERERLRREAILVASLSHPGIVTLHEYCEVNGQPLLVMEWIDGLPLLEYLCYHSLLERDRVSIFQDICEAIEHAHSRGVLHRDIKPSNILIDNENRARIIDFGLAICPDGSQLSDSLKTSESAFVGTVAYAAPERVIRPDSPPDTRCDIYSLCAVFYCMLLGEPDWIVRSDMHRHLLTTPAQRAWPPLSGTRLVCRDLALIIDKGLSPDPEVRYQTVQELNEDLNRFLANRPVLAHPPSKIYELRQLVRRHPVTAPLTVFAIAVLITLTTLSMNYASGERTERLRAQSAEAKAKQKQATLEALAVINQTIMDAAKPDALGGTATIEELLDYTLLNLPNSLDPITQARFEHVLGDRFYKLGRYNEAEKLLHKAVDTFDKSWSQDENLEETLSAHGLLLWTRFNQERDAHALDKMRMHLNQVQSRLGPTHKLSLQTQIDYALALTADKLDEALQVITETSKTCNRTLGSSDELSLVALNALAVIHSRRSEIEQAIQAYEESLALRRANYPTTHTMVATAASNLGSYLANLGYTTRAEPLLREALESRQQSLGENHPSTLITQAKLAGLLSRIGDYSNSQKLFESCIAGMTTEFGPVHSRTLGALNGLGLCYLRAKDYSKAKHTLTDCYAKKLEHTRDIKNIHITASNLALVHTFLDEYNEAIKLYEEIENQSIAIYGHNSDRTLNIRALKAIAINRSGDSKYAIELFDTIYRQRLDTLGPSHPRTLTVILQMSPALFGTSQAKRATTLLASALPALRENSGADSTHAVACAKQLAIAHEHTGALDRAIEVLRDAEYHWIHTGAPQGIRLNRLRYELARIQLKAGMTAEAGQLICNQFAWLLESDNARIDDLGKSSELITECIKEELIQTLW
ncbi:MAG: serine/threonine protein kinase [Phycisphaera sp.]|nr:MAG: serine/threonine protein kinase [Phycisphaera sp.]